MESGGTSGCRVPKTPQVSFNAAQRNHRKLQIMTWNVAGLSQHKLDSDELRLWMTAQGVEIAVLVETHWAWTNEREDEGWLYLHSGDTHTRGKGILVMVNKATCSSQQLRWRECEVLVGCLLHVQLRLTPRPADSQNFIQPWLDFASLDLAPFWWLFLFLRRCLASFRFLFRFWNRAWICRGFATCMFLMNILDGYQKYGSRKLPLAHNSHPEE